MSFFRRGPAAVVPDSQVVCPRDERPLDKVVVDGVTVDRCGRCRGVWFDAGELRRVTREPEIERQATRERRVPLRSPFACPRCAGACNLAYVEEVAVDVCVECKGVWLDAGELEEAKREVEVARILDQGGPGLRAFLRRL